MQDHKPRVVPVYRQHSPLAQLMYNTISTTSVSQNNYEKKSPFHLRMMRMSARFEWFWRSPIFPISLILGHFYIIALYLRNPF